FQRVATGLDEFANGLGVRPLPVGIVGSAYYFAFKFAGGNAPYTVVESPFYSLPTGLSLSTDGVLSGTPQSSGSFILVEEVSDADGYTANTTPSLVVITPAGTQAPLVSPYYPNPVLDDGSVGVPYHGNLDYLFTQRRGVGTQTWSVAA